MTITKTMNGTDMTIALSGRLDTTTAPELERVVKESLGGASALTIDCADLEYISSAGLRVFLTANKIMRSKGGVKLTHVNDMVMEVLEITGFVDILTIEE